MNSNLWNLSMDQWEAKICVVCIYYVEHGFSMTTIIHVYYHKCPTNEIIILFWYMRNLSMIFQNFDFNYYVYYIFFRILKIFLKKDKLVKLPKLNCKTLLFLWNKHMWKKGHIEGDRNQNGLAKWWKKWDKMWS